MNVIYEIIGYTGTALILLSMMMTSVARLRILNISGSVFSMIYGALCGAWPVFLLNICMIAVNVVQLIRLRKKKEEHHETNS